MKTENTFERVFDIMLEKAAKSEYEKESSYIDGLYAETENESLSLSVKGHKKIRKLLAENRRKKVGKQLMANGKKIACVFIIILAGLAITTFGVEAWRVKVLNFVFDRSSPGTTFTFAERGAIRNAVGDFELEYIPEGFELSEKKHSKSMFDAIYKNFENSKSFSLSVRFPEGLFDIDTENAEIETIEINGYEGVYITNKRHNAFVWNDDNYAYILMGSISKDELYKILEGIREVR